MHLKSYLESFNLLETTIFSKFLMRNVRKIKNQSYKLDSKYSSLLIGINDSEKEKVLKSCQILFEALQQLIFKSNPIIYNGEKHYYILRLILNGEYEKAINEFWFFTLDLSEYEKFLFNSFRQKIKELIKEETEKSYNILYSLKLVSKRTKTLVKKTKEYNILFSECMKFLRESTGKNFHKMSKINLPDDMRELLAICQKGNIKIKKENYTKNTKNHLKTAIKVDNIEKQVENLILALYQIPGSVKISLNRNNYSIGKFSDFSYSLIRHFFKYISLKSKCIKGFFSLNISVMSSISFTSKIKEFLMECFKLILNKYKKFLNNHKDFVQSLFQIYNEIRQL